MSHAQIQSVDDLSGPAGKLEALLNAGREDAPYAALVAHPHPLGGGTLHTKAVYHAAKAFSHFGLPVLRFNFRGVGLSEGAHDEGRGEKYDVHAALDWLTGRFAKPILFAGFSFGAAIGLRACCGDVRVKGLVGLGLPLNAEGRTYSYKFLQHCTQPKLFLSGGNDKFSPRTELEAVIATAADPKQLVWVHNADHFFAGTSTSPASKLEAMQAELRRWLAANFSLHR